MNSSAKQIAVQCLRKIRTTLGIIQTNLRLNPYRIDHSQLESIVVKLEKQQQQASKLLLRTKLAPPLFTCSLLSSFVISASQVISQDISNDFLTLKMMKREQWANNSIRELNQLELEEKQLRQLLIEFRNALQQYTMDKELKGSPARLVKHLL